MKKKMISLFSVAALVVAVMPVNAFAHGGHGRGVHCGTGTRYSTCTIQNCNRTDTHQHNGVNYGGHYAGDGHAYHCW